MPVKKVRFSLTSPITADLSGFDSVDDINDFRLWLIAAGIAAEIDASTENPKIDLTKTSHVTLKFKKEFSKEKLYEIISLVRSDSDEFVTYQLSVIPTDTSKNEKLKHAGPTRKKSLIPVHVKPPTPQRMVNFSDKGEEYTLKSFHVRFNTVFSEAVQERFIREITQEYADRYPNTFNLYFDVKNNASILHCRVMLEPSSVSDPEAAKLNDNLMQQIGHRAKEILETIKAETAARKTNGTANKSVHKTPSKKP